MPSAPAAAPTLRPFWLAARALMVGLLVALAVVAVASARDLPPDGPGCVVVDAAESSVMLGVQETRWEPQPIRACVSDGRVVTSGDELVWGVAVSAGLFGGALAGDRFAARDRRVRRRADLGSVAREVLDPWRQRPYEAAVALVDQPDRQVWRSAGGDVLRAEVHAVEDPLTREVCAVATVDGSESGRLGHAVVGRAQLVVRPEPAGAEDVSPGG